MNLKIHGYNLETVLVRCNGATIFVIALTFFNKVRLNLNIHGYNLERVIVGYNGATIFVIALDRT